MPSKSPAQANLMRAVAHGWKKPGGGGPSRSVAREFVNADRKYSGGFAENRYWTGGLAAMNEINSGVKKTLDFQAGGPVLPLTGRAAMQAALEPVEGAALQNIDMSAFMTDDSTMARGVREGMMAGLTSQGYFGGEDNIWYAPTPTVTGAAPPEPRVIPGAVGAPPPAGSPFGGNAPPPNMVGGTPGLTRAEQTAARRETPYRQQLREHQARIVSALNPAPVSGARGGHMNYQEGGTATARRTPVTGGGAPIPGHSEGTNPFLPGEERYKTWEDKYHWFEPSSEPPPEEQGGLIAWLLDTLGYGNVEAAATRSEDELKELGEARGGRVGYQGGGLAQAQGQRQPGRGFRPPRGGVPPSMRGLPPRRGGIPPRMAPPTAPPGQVHAGGSPGFYAPGGPGRGGGAQADLGPGGGGIPGGPRVPPNMRGYLQKQRMMNRPPSNVGGGVNRVGQGDQQGGLSRALQRGTGRPPMSRRAGFGRR